MKNIRFTCLLKALKPNDQKNASKRVTNKVLQLFSGQLKEIRAKKHSHYTYHKKKEDIYTANQFGTTKCEYDTSSFGHIKLTKTQRFGQKEQFALWEILSK